MDLIDVFSNAWHCSLNENRSIEAVLDKRQTVFFYFFISCSPLLLLTIG
jgi:hypothetical protein